MKRILLFIGAVAFISIFSIPLYAQEEDTTTDSVEVTEEGADMEIVGPDEELIDTITEEEAKLVNPYEMELLLGTQSPWTKNIPVIVKFKPTIESERTEISWDVPYGVTVSPSYENFFAANEGEAFEKEAKFNFEQPGTYNVTATITNWGYGENVTSSETIKIKIGEDLLSDPLTVGYNTASMIRYIIILTSIVLLSIGLFFGGKKGVGALKEWLKPPEL